MVFVKRKIIFYSAGILIVMATFYLVVKFINREILINNEDGFWLDGITRIFKKTDSQDKFNNLNPIPAPEKDRLDILILGIRGDDKKSVTEEGGLLTDTILLVSVDKINKKPYLVSVPRDLYIDTPEIKGKINEVYERGLEKNRGIAFAKETTSRITGIYIDNAIVFDFNSFKEIVDKIGGIDIYLTEPFAESKQWGYEFDLPAGKNHLNGEQALYYARSRYSTSDFDRSRRQQEIIKAIENKIISLGYLSDYSKIISILSDLKGNIKTDFQIWNLGDLFSLANSFGKKTKINDYVISTDNLLHQSKTEKGEFILLPNGNNYDGIREFFKNIFVNG